MSKRRFLVFVLVTLVVVLSTVVGTVQSQTTELPPLNDYGPYGVGMKLMNFVDENREDWTLQTYVWFPADKTQGTPAPTGPLIKKAVPDMSGAPYPLIVYSHGWGGTPAELSDVVLHLASQGYVVAGVQHHDADPPVGELIDRPLDILTLIDGLAAITEGDLAGLIDTDNVGLMGYSQGAATSFEMLGLLSDPLHYETWCAEHSDLITEDCQLPLVDTAAYRDSLGLETLPDGRWMPFGDARIRAVFVIAPCGFPLTTEDMLASVTTPVMILHGTKDLSCDYEGNAVGTYTYLGTEDRYLITAVNVGHLGFDALGKAIEHFETAFFGYYLTGDEIYAPYLTPEGMPAWERPPLVWGPYEGE